MHINAFVLKDLEPEQDVYLIDNWFTFPLRRFGKMLEKDLLLLDRVEQLIGISPLGGGKFHVLVHVSVSCFIDFRSQFLTHYKQGNSINAYMLWLFWIN